MIYLVAIGTIIKNLIIVLATGYVVFGLGRSPWWFLIALFFIALTGVSIETKSKDEPIKCLGHVPSNLGPIGQALKNQCTMPLCERPRTLNRELCSLHLKE